MIKRKCVYFILLFCLITLSGCETTKGMQKDAESFNLYRAIMNVDNWIRENVC